MKRIENRCIECSSPSYPCLGKHCPYRNAIVYYCDECGVEITDKVHGADGEHYCTECFEKLNTNLEEE